MAKISPQQLPQQLKKGISPLYVIFGDEDVLRLESLDAIRHSAKSAGFTEREVLFADNYFDWSRILLALDSPGLFADKQILEVHIPSGKPGKQGGEVLQKIHEHLSELVCVIVFLPKLERAQTQSKWFASLAKNADVIEAKEISLRELPSWIQQRLSLVSLGIEDDALSLFAQKVEGNLLAAKQEIEKLALLHPKNHVLTLEDAQNAIVNVARFDVFGLTQAWMAGDVIRTMHLIEGLEAQASEPILLLWSLSEDIRTLLRLQAALSRGQSVSSVKNTLRLWGDKQTLAPKALKRLGARRLLLALKDCARIDRQLKGAEKGDVWVSIKDLLMLLASTPSQ